MATLHPKLAPLHWRAAGGARPKHTVELFLDFVCPFSRRLFLALYDGVLSKDDEGAWRESVEFVFRPQVQPWHPASTLVHEAAVAVAVQLSDSDADEAERSRRWWRFARELFAQSDKYYDSHTIDETRAQSYRRLAQLADHVSPGTEADILDQLHIDPAKTPDAEGDNGGNKVTNIVKLPVKYGRLVGIHVSPTVLTDGAVANAVSSGWSAQQWQEYLDKLK